MVDVPPKTSTAFYEDIKSAFGEHIAQAAIGALRRSGIDPQSLTFMAMTPNTRAFCSDGLVCKVGTHLENHQTEPVKDALVLQPLRSATLGFDMGGAAIELEVMPRLQTQAVEPRHVKALCYELAQRGLIFHDNKLANVALTASGLPYVIDGGAVVRKSELRPFEREYLYPEMSGQKAAGWEQEAKEHGFVWPAEQAAIPEIAAQLAALKQNAVSARPAGGGAVGQTRR